MRRSRARRWVVEHLTGDAEVHADPEKYFDQAIEIDLSTLEPHERAVHARPRPPISKFGEEVKKNGWPAKSPQGLIGSCTNSSYEDLTRGFASPSRPSTS